MQLISDGVTSFSGGVNDSVAPDEYLPNQSQVMINCRPDERGMTAAELTLPVQIGDGAGGAPSTNNPFLLKSFYTAAGAQITVAIFDSTAYVSTDNGETYTIISGATGLDEQYWSAVVFREGSSNILCLANGGTSCYQYDGTTWSTISNIPSGTKYLAVLGDRLIAAGGDGTTVAASAVGDIDNGYGASAGGWTVKATTHDGDVDIKGLFTLGSSLLVFKRRSVGFIEGFGYQTLQVSAGARGLSRSVGCVAHRTIAPIGDDGVMWLSERGFEFFQVGGRVQLASEFQREFVNSIAWQTILDNEGLPCAIWVPGVREYWCSLPVAVGAGEDLNNTNNSYIWCYRAPTQVTPPAAFMLYWSLQDGYVMEIDANGELDWYASGFTSLYQSPDGLLAGVDQYGELRAAALPTPGLGALLSNGEVDLPTEGINQLRDGRIAPNCLDVIDRPGRPAAPCGACAANDVFEYDTGQGEPAGLALYTRPLVFNNIVTRKKAKRVTLLASVDNATNVYVGSVADGSSQTAQTMAFPANVGQEASERRIRVGGRGRQQQVRVFTAGTSGEAPLNVRAIVMDAAPLRDQI